MALTKVPLSLLDAPGASGNVLTSDGTSWTSAAAAPGVPTGGIIIGPATTATTTAASGTGSVATITFTPAYTIPVGSIITVAGVTPSGYNGTYTVTASSSGSVSYASSTTGSQTVAGTCSATMQGFLRCDGAYYTRAAYPALAAYIGTPVLAAPAINTYTNASLTINSNFGGANNILATTGTASAPSSGAAVSGGMFTSTDGTTWTSRTAWNIGTFYNAGYYQPLFVYNNGVYLAATNCASGAYIQYSSDLATWNKSAIYVGTGNSTWYVYGVCAGGTSNVFVSQAGGDNGCTGGSSGIVYSTNGASWTQVTLPSPITQSIVGWMDGAGYSGGVVLSVGYYSGGNKSRYIYSATGTSYTDVSMGSAESARIISYTNGRFIAGTSDGKLYTSTTGAGGTWSLASSPGTSISLQKIYWNGTAYVATNGNYSLDLITWFSGTSAITTQANNKLWYRTGTSFYYWDFNAYTTATQFPVPSLGIGQYNMPSSGFSNYAYYIKT